MSEKIDVAESLKSLPEAHRSVLLPKNAGFWRRFLAFAGPGYLVSVGYMDPGNWATDLAGGAKFAYLLLSVILISNLMAVLLQSLCVRLGVATGMDLAQACRASYGRKTTWGLWILCELAIIACDLAELVGSAIGLQLLFGLPLAVGVCLTALDVMLILYLQNKGFRYIEALVVGLIAIIGACFAVEIFFAKPDLAAVFKGFVPSAEILRNPEALYIAIGILGATVMPHNLYLHSALVQTRCFEETPEGRREAIKFGTLDSTVALTFALFINAAILILSASSFHFSGNKEVAEIQDAYGLLAPLLGTSLASTLFAVALLLSGQNSTLTGTLAGQIVMEGFVRIRLKPWLRRLITRLLALVPALLVIIYFGEQSTTGLLVFSQVVLSLQLPFAVVPLVKFTTDKKIMGEFAAPNWIKFLAWTIAAIIISLNCLLLFQTAKQFFNL